MPWQKQFDRDEALEKAMHAFWSRGYEATSMQDLVGCMGINRGSLYATYRDKRTLFLAALQRYGDRMHGEIMADLEARHAPREAIRRVFAAFLEDVPDGKGSHGCFLTNTALELAPHDPEIGRIVAQGQERVEAFFARMIAKGQVQGDIPGHVEPAGTARGLLASLIGLAVLTRSRPDRALLQTIADDALRRLD